MKVLPHSRNSRLFAGCLICCGPITCMWAITGMVPIQIQFDCWPRWAGQVRPYVQQKQCFPRQSWSSNNTSESTCTTLMQRAAKVVCLGVRDGGCWFYFLAGMIVFLNNLKDAAHYPCAEMVFMNWVRGRLWKIFHANWRFAQIKPVVSFLNVLFVSVAISCPCEGC